MLLSLNQSGHLASMSVSTKANLKADLLLSFPLSVPPLQWDPQTGSGFCVVPSYSSAKAADWISAFFL